MSSVLPISLGMVKTFLIKGKKPVLVDTGMPGSHGKVVAGIKNYGVDPKDIDLIIVTHCHSDHVGSLAKLKEITGAKVMVHKSEAKYLKNGESPEIKATGRVGKLLMKAMPKQKPLPLVEADITVDDELLLNDFGVQGRVIHAPGHTPGSLTIILENGEVIAGDSVGGPGPMTFWRTSYPTFVADMDVLKRSLRELVDLPVTTIHNSHGGPVTKDQLAKLLTR